MKGIRIQGLVKIFPQKGGWTYVSVPKKISKPLLGKAERGLIPIEATVGKSTWKTSLLPMGDGTHFIALNAKVRKQEGIELGKKVTLWFKVRFSY